ncbi:MAG: hypothetical protein QM490_04885 [Candidatus Gracilibacteria bacterium]
MYSEKIVETKICKQCNSSFDITDKDVKFYDKISPVFVGKKIQIPTPTFCFDCGLQRRLVWRNDKNLYTRKCDKTNENIISMYSPDKLNKIYNQDLWWSDKWDAIDYGVDFDFNMTFSLQYNELLLKVPHPSLIKLTSENSDYSNYIAWSKNTYLCFAGDNIENSLYCYNVVGSNDCIDDINVRNSDFIYETINSNNSTRLFFARDSNNSNNSYFIKNCDGCEYCFMCFNLKNKKYCINNKQYTKNEYKKFINNINLGDNENLNKYKNEFIKKESESIHKSNNNINALNCKGDYIVDSVNCNNSFFVSSGGEDIKNIMIGFNDLKDSYDCTYCGVNASKFYESIASGGNGNNCFFSNIIVDNFSNIFYSNYCVSSKNLFGCVGLKNKEYCIFNKQYSKEEYESLVLQIIEHMKKTGEWGEFFPSNISPFGYNETVASEYYPLTKEEALKLGFKWSGYKSPPPKVEKVIPADKLPNNIKNIPDDILNWAIECQITKKLFRIMKQELAFYRKFDLPIPRIHPNQRHLNRIGFINSINLNQRNCSKCDKKIETTFDLKEIKIVYCEECYNKKTY